MKFIIRRASDWGNEQPHKKAYKELVDGKKVWFVNIDTMNDLKQLIDKECDSFIIYFNENDENYKYPAIYIYDDYVE